MKRKLIDMAITWIALLTLLYLGGWGAAIAGAVWAMWSYADGRLRWSQGGANG